MICGRESAVKALVAARKFLPKGYNFKIWDMKRSRKTQLEIISSFRKRFQLMYPRLSAKRIDSLVYTYAAKPYKKVQRLDTHRNGGAVDLTIVDGKGRELYMGTDHDNLTVESALDYYEEFINLNQWQKQAWANRRLLKKVMLSAGWHAYPPEWWHWEFSS